MGLIRLFLPLIFLIPQVIGAPKTIDGDLKTEHIPVSFGFDTVRRRQEKKKSGALR